jgi:hypothetical protein
MAKIFQSTEGRETNSAAIAQSLATIALGRRSNSAHLLPCIRLIAVVILISRIAVSTRQSPPVTNLRARDKLAGARDSASRRRHQHAICSAPHAASSEPVAPAPLATRTHVSAPPRPPAPRFTLNLQPIPFRKLLPRLRGPGPLRPCHHQSQQRRASEAHARSARASTRPPQSRPSWCSRMRRGTPGNMTRARA